MLCQKTCDVPFGITAIVSAPVLSRRPPQADANSVSTNAVTNTLHHGGHGGRGGTILNENDLNLCVPRVLRGGEVMPRGGDVVPRGGESITIVLQAARLPSDSRIAAR